MDTVRFGTTGLKVSRLCLGCMSYGGPDPRWTWALDEEGSRASIKHALELGINFFDTADVYCEGKSEEYLGRALRDFASRDEVVIATKVFWSLSGKPNSGGLSRKHILSGIDASLKRLGTDYVDLYQIHRWDYETPIEETMEALNDVVRAGKVRYVGASSMYAWQFAKALYTSDRHGWARFVSMQPLYNLSYREEEREMFPLCHDQGIAVIPWSPLAGGWLSRKPSEDQSATARGEKDFSTRPASKTELDDAIQRRVADIAEARGVPMAQVAIAWITSKAVVTAPIIGATKLRHLDDAVAALAIALTADEIKHLEEPYRPRPVAGHA